MLSQRLSVKDEELKQITSKNKVLSDDLMKVTKKLSEVERQQQEQLQRNEQQQEKVIESCQQVRNCYQTCGTTNAKRVNIMFTSTSSDEFSHLVGVVLMRHLQMENCLLEFMKLCVNFVPLIRVNPSLDLRGTPPNSLHVYGLRIRRSAHLRAVHC